MSRNLKSMKGYSKDAKRWDYWRDVKGLWQGRSIYIILLVNSSKFMFRPASMEELSRCHDRKYIDLIESTKDMNPSALK